jgi:hypothetical protein
LAAASASTAALPKKDAFLTATIDKIERIQAIVNANLKQIEGQPIFMQGQKLYQQQPTQQLRFPQQQCSFASRGSNSISASNS